VRSLASLLEAAEPDDDRLESDTLIFREFKNVPKAVPTATNLKLGELQLEQDGIYAPVPVAFHFSRDLEKDGALGRLTWMYFTQVENGVAKNLSELPRNEGIVYVDSKGLLFRVDESGGATNAKDEAVVPKGPFRLAVKRDLGASAGEWGQLFGDYELFTPFDQFNERSRTITSERSVQIPVDELERGLSFRLYAPKVQADHPKAAFTELEVTLQGQLRYGQRVFLTVEIDPRGIRVLHAGKKARGSILDSTHGFNLISELVAAIKKRKVESWVRIILQKHNIQVRGIP
jgi:hypothetical protein